MKGEIRAANRASLARKGLSDITNSQMAFKILGQDSKPSQSAEITRAYVVQLLQDKSELVKLLDERNKIIDLNGVELQTLRGSYQKSQFQNWNLARTNSQMLAELNMSKEKLKVLQHELACKNALLRAKNLELERKVAENSMKAAPVEVEQEAPPKDNSKNNTVNRINRRHQRSQSLGVPNLNKQEETEKEKVENKRRRSVRLVSQESEPDAENLFEIEEAKFPLRRSLQTLMREFDPSNEHKEIRNSSSRPERASIGRPSRRAAEKVVSYKETPVNVKMRRER